MATKEEYVGNVHAMQSAVAAKMAIDPAETTPKHLRVGVNSAMCDQAALVQLLVAKGVITIEEYGDAITQEMAREVERYKQWFAQQGLPVDFI